MFKIKVEVWAKRNNTANNNGRSVYSTNFVPLPNQLSANIGWIMYSANQDSVEVWAIDKAITKYNHANGIILKNLRIRKSITLGR